MARQANGAGSGSVTGEGAVRRRSARASSVRRTKRNRTSGPMRLCWAVVNSTLQQVAIYEYASREQADRRAHELTERLKVPHYVLAVRVPVDAPKAR